MSTETKINNSQLEKIQQLKMLLKSPQKRLFLLSCIGDGLTGVQLEISKRIVFSGWY
jgi:hypothetical protein